MPKLILHVTAALGGGVAHSLSQLAKAQMNDGYRVMVAYSQRTETPADEILEKLFPKPIQRVILPIATEVKPLSDIVSTFKLIRLFQRLDPAIIHLHSSKIGILGRVASRILGKSAATFYSPRGFSFLREDVSQTARRFYILFERLAAQLGGTLVACSPSEASLAHDLLKPANLAMVENSVELVSIPMAHGSVGDSVRIAISGRICYQKAPWHVRDVILAMQGKPANFVWIGDGELKHELEVENRLPDSLSITGWKDREGVIKELAASDIFLLPSLWEGMPLALIEAQVAGLPALVMDVVGCRDVVVDGVTGYVCKSIAELIARTEELVAKPDLRRQMAIKARSLALARFSVERMHREMCCVYRLQ